MKILHVNKFFDLHGGAEIYLHELMRRQQEAGDDAHVVSTRSSGNLPSEDRSRFVTRYDYSRFTGVTVEDGKKALNYLWNREAERAMEQAIVELKPDVIHLHNIYHHLSTSILSPIRRHRIPCVQTLHDLKLACPNYKMYTEGAPCERCKGGNYLEAVKHHCISASFLPNMLAAAEMGMTKSRQSYERTVQTFICPSQFMADKMVEWGEPPSKFTVVRMASVRTPVPASRGGGYLLAVGRLSPEKGYEELVRAMAHVPNMRLKIAGIGPLEDRLLSGIQERGQQNVELVGFQRGEALADLYRNAEAFVASPVGYENAPLTVLDAIGYGLPVIATHIGGLPEMVKDGVSGYLVERGNQDMWVAALKRFAALSGPERDAMASSSRRHAESTFPTWDGHRDEVSRVYEHAISSAKRRT